MVNELSDFQTIIDVLRFRALTQPEKIAYTFLGDDDVKTSISYFELNRKAKTVATFLKAAGLSGSPVLLAYPTGIEFIICFLGCLYARSIAIPVYPPDPINLNSTLPRLEAIVGNSGSKALLTDANLIESVSPLLGHFPLFSALKKISLNSIDVNTIDEDIGSDVGLDTIAFLQYTSGSTSRPKGVILNHKNIIEFEKRLQWGMSFYEDATYVGWLPLHHDAGLIGNTLCSLYGGTHCVFMSPLTLLKRPFKWLKAISDYKGTTSGGPNFGYELCVRKVSEEQRNALDLSHWKVAWSSAEPVRYETIERFSSYFQPCGFKKSSFHPCYGLAEATLAVTYSKEGPRYIHLERKSLEKNIAKVDIQTTNSTILVSAGKIYTYQNLRIIDPKTRQECREDQVGEIWIQGPNVALGYWDNPEETKTTFQAEIEGKDLGFFLRTGDMGFLKDDELYITGRLKDMLIIRGQNYYPQDIELVAEKAHPSIRPGCVASFSTENNEEERLVLLAEIYSKDVKKNNNDEKIYEEFLTSIKRKIQAAVIDFFQIQAYKIILLEENTLPKTSSGKHQRFLAKEKFLKNSLRVL